MKEAIEGVSDALEAIAIYAEYLARELEKNDFDMPCIKDNYEATDTEIPPRWSGLDLPGLKAQTEFSPILSIPRTRGPPTKKNKKA